MKLMNINISRLLLVVAATFALSSCNDFLNDIPKGQRIPATWADYNAFIKNTNTYHYHEMDQLFYLVGDQFLTPNKLNSDRFARANYYWDESVKRVEAMASTDKNPYFSAYEAIFAWNLIIEYAPEATECTNQQREMLIAQARVLRAMNYFYLANYFAAPYGPDNLQKLSVPMVTSSSVESPSPQVTIEKLYAFILDDLNKAVAALPEEGETRFHPTQAAGYGMLARVYLAMGNYEEALKNANAALALNDKLYDWIAFYNDDKKRFDDPNEYSASCKSNPEFENPENYLFRYGSSNDWQGIKGTAYALPAERATKFEKGDTRLITHWKDKTSSSGIRYFAGIYGLSSNKGGMRAAEMYYIKAECLARKGGEANIKEAMDLVNKVRKTRILPDDYKAWTASTTKEAVNKIFDDKANEFIQSQVIFCDYRRLNQDPEYARVLTRTEDKDTYRLQPTSHLWIMPFPMEAITNPGNGTLTQNVDK